MVGNKTKLSQNIIESTKGSVVKKNLCHFIYSLCSKLFIPFLVMPGKSLFAFTAIMHVFVGIFDHSFFVRSFEVGRPPCQHPNL